MWKSKLVKPGVVVKRPRVQPGLRGFGCDSVLGRIRPKNNFK
jgi:hypothetical protein